MAAQEVRVGSGLRSFRLTVPMVSAYDLPDPRELNSVLSQSMLEAERTIPSGLARSVARIGSKDAVARLLVRPVVELGVHDYHALLDRWADEEGILDLVIGQVSLPPAIAHRLTMMVDVDRVSEVATKHGIELKYAIRLNQRGRDIRFLRNFVAGQSVMDVRKLVTSLAENQLLKPALVLSAYCLGYTSFVMLAIVKLTDCWLKTAKTLMADPTNHGALLLFRLCGFPGSYLTLFVRLSELARRQPNLTTRPSALWSSVVGNIIDNGLHSSAADQVLTQRIADVLIMLEGKTFNPVWPSGTAQTPWFHSAEI